MDLPALFSSTTETQVSYLTIVVNDVYVQSALWSFQAGRVVLLEKSDVHEYHDEKECFLKTDLSLQELGSESEGVDEVVFGLEPDWVTGGEINPSKKTFLKHLTEKLSLKAVGFVVTVEALHQFLVKIQPQLSALVIQSEQKNVRVSFVRQGVLLRTEVVGKSGTLPADVTEAFARWSTPDELAAAYPSRILLTSDQLSEEELSSEEQMILNYDWVSEKLFLHPPIVELLRPGTVLEAVVNEGGKAVAQTQGLVTPQSEVENLVVMKTAAAEAAMVNGAAVIASQPLPGTRTSEEEFDFEPAAAFEPSAPPVRPARKIKWPAFLRHRGPYSHHPYIVSGLVLGIILVLGIGYLYLQLTTKVVVTLVLKTLPIAKEVTINLDPSTTSSSTSELRLAAQRQNKEFEKSTTLPTTGLKKVGDKAKGKVLLFNKTTSTKTFNAGTVLTNGAFKYTLDAEATIASASVVTSGASETKTFGRSEVLVSAVEIGPESNLAKDVELKIASFDPGTYSAQSVVEFSGGSSREMRVVAEVDRQKILSTLRSEILAEAATAFKQEGRGVTYTVPSGKMTLSKTTYSAKTGDEAEELNLALVATVEGLTYQTDQLKPLALQALAAQVPSQYELQPDTLQILSEPQSPTSSDSAQVVVKANLAAQAVPLLNQDVLKTRIAGQSLSQVEEILKGDSLIVRFGLKFSPALSRYLVRQLPPANRLTLETQ